MSGLGIWTPKQGPSVTPTLTKVFALDENFQAKFDAWKARVELMLEGQLEINTTEVIDDCLKFEWCVRRLGRYMCARRGCNSVGTIMTEMGGMCLEHSNPLMFPLQRAYTEAPEVNLRLPELVPWEFMKPFDHQCQRNHRQALARIAQRGGLDATEALAVIENRLWAPIKFEVAIDRFLERLEAWKGST